jgi:hypothetical protein
MGAFFVNPHLDVDLKLNNAHRQTALLMVLAKGRGGLSRGSGPSSRTRPLGIFARRSLLDLLRIADLALFLCHGTTVNAPVASDLRFHLGFTFLASHNE